MTEIKLVALDLDGTLLTSQKEVTADNRRALREAREAGVKVVITTGRPLKAIEHLLEDLDLMGSEDYSVTFNGGLVQRNTGEILAKSALTFAQLETIVAMMEPLGLPVDIISEGTVYGLPSRGNHSLYRTANPMLTFVELESLDQLPTDVVYNKVVIVYHSDYLDEQIGQLPEQVYQQFEVFKSRDIILEIMPKGVHKAVGLEVLTQHLGLSSDQVTAMGDEENDLSMLAWAGLGVAMANGTDQVKQVAKAITTRTNEESGVAEAIDQYVLKK